MKRLRTVTPLAETAQVRVPRTRSAEPRGGACGSGPGRVGGRRGLQGSGPAPGRCDSQARKGAGLVRGRGTSPCEPEALPHVPEARRWGRGPPLGGPEFLAAPPPPPFCLRPDSRGGRGGDQAGSGCAAAALPAQVGECGPGRVYALLEGGRSRGLRNAEATSRGTGKPRWKARAGGIRGPRWSHARGVVLRAAGGRLGAAGGRRAREDPLGGSGAALQPPAADLCGTAPSTWTGGATRCLERGVALRFLVYPE